jgi:exodeoxyribonuclease V alpha subunit
MYGRGNGINQNISAPAAGQDPGPGALNIEAPVPPAPAGGVVTVSGTVVSVIYSSEDTGYTVLRLETGEGEQMTVVGCLPYAAPGEAVIVSGSWVTHSSHGEQFQAKHAERIMPRGADAIYAYLSSGVIKGIGPATAMLIVNRFGEETLNVLENNPGEISKVRGISLKKAEEISKAFRRQTGLRKLMEFFGSFDLKPQLAMRMYKFYGETALEILHENPYIIAREHIGASFSEADALALELGFEGDSVQRISAAVLFELVHNAENGHSFIPRHKLSAATAQLIGVEEELVEEGIEALSESGEIVISEVAGLEACYLCRLFEAETYAAGRVAAMSSVRYENSADSERLISDIERRTGISYAPLQRRALQLALRRQIVVITGGPGTGKTTSIKAILDLFNGMGLSTVMAAPTGRAAKRMTELTGREASTIHRLLEAGYSGDGYETVFKRDESDPLSCDAIILDECSMIDILLFGALLSAMPPECRLVMVGDADQLPSVGPGNVFSDIIKSGTVETVHLTEIFRQISESRIIEYAHMINSASISSWAGTKGTSFSCAGKTPPGPWRR